MKPLLLAAFFTMSCFLCAGCVSDSAPGSQLDAGLDADAGGQPETGSDADHEDAGDTDLADASDGNPADDHQDDADDGGDGHGSDAADDGGLPSDAGDIDGDSCIPHWVDVSDCDCQPATCAACSGQLLQEDGCGHQQTVSCQLTALGCPDDQACDDDGRCGWLAANPLMDGDHPDPHVMRIQGTDGGVTYYLVHTVGDASDIPIYTSHDLVHWDLLPDGAFSRPRTPGDSIQVNYSHFCSIWAPHLAQVSEGVFLLGFSATRHASAQTPCPAYGDNGGVYLASAANPGGPYALAEQVWEPFPAGANGSTCDPSIRYNVPYSVDVASSGCQGNYCHKIIRLDSDVFHDPIDGRWWMAYSWYTNSPPQVDWETTNHGEHVHIVELDGADPFAVTCDLSVPQVFAANCHDDAMLGALASSCPRCGEMLSFTRGRYGEEMLRDGISWGVVEGASLFRRGEFVYLLLSGSGWDSAYYHVYWVAAPTVEDLVISNPERIAGRYLIPSQDQAFGHGSAVLGPDGKHWYFVHHRLDSPPCIADGQCSRDLWISPIEFEDKGDGRGDVYIRSRFPAEDPLTVVSVR